MKGRWVFALALYFLAGCAKLTQPADLIATPGPLFRAATPAGYTTPTATLPVNLPNLPSPEITFTATPCQDSLTFLSDITIPDGTTVLPNASLDKRWEVENSGSCNWDERYQVRLVSGPDLNAPRAQALYPARSGARVILRIQFQAPDESGDYRSAWQAFNAAGEPFGDPFFVDIMVP